MDIYMPEMDGRELISAMRAQRPDLPIIAISPALLRDSGQIALNIVPADVIRLRNPFRPFELIKAIQSAMTPAALPTPAPARYCRCAVRVKPKPKVFRPSDRRQPAAQIIPPGSRPDYLPRLRRPVCTPPPWVTTDCNSGSGCSRSKRTSSAASEGISDAATSQQISFQFGTLGRVP